MGAYLASQQGGFSGLFGLFPAKANVYFEEPGAQTTTIDDTEITVKWRGKVRRVYYAGGPAYILPRGTAGITVLAHYTNGEVAAAVAKYEKGKVAVSGPHVEAPTSWYSEYNVPYHGSTQDLGNDLLDTLMH